MGRGLELHVGWQCYLMKVTMGWKVGPQVKYWISCIASPLPNSSRDNVISLMMIMKSMVIMQIIMILMMMMTRWSTVQ